MTAMVFSSTLNSDHPRTRHEEPAAIRMPPEGAQGASPVVREMPPDEPAMLPPSPVLSVMLPLLTAPPGCPAVVSSRAPVRPERLEPEPMVTAPPAPAAAEPALIETFAPSPVADEPATTVTFPALPFNEEPEPSVSEPDRPDVARPETRLTAPEPCATAPASALASTRSPESPCADGPESTCTSPPCPRLPALAWSRMAPPTTSAAPPWDGAELPARRLIAPPLPPAADVEPAEMTTEPPAGPVLAPPADRVMLAPAAEPPLSTRA